MPLRMAAMPPLINDTLEYFRYSSLKLAIPSRIIKPSNSLHPIIPAIDQMMVYPPHCQIWFVIDGANTKRQKKFQGEILTISSGVN